jgi:F0F1-type ATP synthase beta subunit
MVRNTLGEHALKDDFARKVGKIVEVRGPIVDAQFTPDSLPALLSALTISDQAGNGDLAVAVAQHLGNGKVRCVALSPTDRVTPGMEVVNSGGLVQTPLAQETLRRTVEAFTGESAGKETAPGTVEVLETGIKALDLLCPYRKGGTVNVLGPMGVGKLVLIEEVVHNVAAKEGGVTFFTFAHPGTEVSWEQESLNNGSGFGSTQTIILSAEDLVEPGTTEAAFDATTYVILERARQSLYPAVDPIRSTSRLLDPAVVGQRHYDVAQGVRELLRRAYQWEAAGAGAQLGEDDRRRLARARTIDQVVEKAKSSDGSI